MINKKVSRSRKMRIVIDLTSLADNFSGIERYAMSIAEELIALDSERKNTYILLFKRKVHKEFEKYKGRKNVVFKVYPGRNKLVFQQIILPFHLYRIKADAYLFLAFQSPVLFLRKGIYNTIHDLTSWDCPETMKKKMELYFKLTIRNALWVSKGIIVNSKFTRDRIVDKFHYDKKKITIAYCGISDVFMNYIASQPSEVPGSEENKKEIEARLEKIRNKSLDIRHKYHLPEQYLLCLATLEPRKNLPFLVEAYVELLEEGKTKFPQANTSFADIPLVLAGRKGWKMDEFLNRIEEEYRKYIVVTGFIEDEDLPYVYHMADCFIFPSIYEGFGMPPLEAMAVGTMVISSDAASLPEVLGKAASYFHSGNKEELKEKMRQGLHQECDEVTVREIKKRVEMFQWRKSAKKIEERIQ